MSFDKYSDKAAEAIALIREFAKVEYWDFFKGDPEQALEAFCAMQDAAEEMGRMKAQDSAAPQDNVPGVSELPVVKTWQERMPKPKTAWHCAMNCSGIFNKPADFNCGDCEPFTIRGDPIAARDAEIADLRAALRAYGQRAAVAVPEWISVDDRLPDEGTDVLALRLGKQCIAAIFVEVQSYEEGGRRIRYWDDPNDDGQGWEWYEVTHWMPLPAVPGAAPSQPQQEAVPAEPKIDLHDAIMNLPCNPPEPDPDALDDGETYAYRCGHRDARHAAAELVNAMSAAKEPGDE